MLSGLAAFLARTSASSGAMFAVSVASIVQRTMAARSIALHGPVDSHLFHCVIGLAESCGVEESEQDAIYLACVFYYVACGAGDVADDGTVLPEESVQ